MVRKVLVVSVVIMLAGCSASPQQMRLQSEVNSLDKRLQLIEQQPSTAASNVGERLNSIGRQQANLKADLDSLRAEVQNLSGKVEEQQHRIMQMHDEIDIANNDINMRMAALEKAKVSVTAVNQPPKNSGIKPLPAAAATVTAPPVSVIAPPVSGTTAVVKNNGDNGSAQSLYNQALTLVQKEKQFAASRKLFKQFLHQYPDNKLAVNAMYWIGETYYGDKEYENAILQFQDVIQQHPDHSKVAAALMKQGLAFYAFGDVKNARAILHKVVSGYPGTPIAKKAQQKLNGWK